MIIHDIEVYRYFRYQDAIRFCAYATTQRSMPRIPSKYLYYNYTVMAKSGGLEVPGKNSYPVDRGISAHTIRLEVEVHRLRDMNARYPLP